MFEPFGAAHGAMVVIFVAFTTLIVRAARRAPTADERDRFTIRLGLFLGALFILLEGYYLVPAHFKLADNVPIHLCDLAWGLSSVALLTRRRWAIAPLYYWGLTLCSQGLMTPILHAEVGSVRFAQFWVSHITIVSTAIYAVLGLGYRPRWRDVPAVYLGTVVWATMVYNVNRVLGTNYMFLNRLPDQPSLLDRMGPWPDYIFVAALVLLGVWIAITVPWQVASRRRMSAEPSRVLID